MRFSRRDPAHEDDAWPPATLRLGPASLPLVSRRSLSLHLTALTRLAPNARAWPGHPHLLALPWRGRQLSTPDQARKPGVVREKHALIGGERIAMQPVPDSSPYSPCQELAGARD